MESYYIHTDKYRLEIKQVLESKKMEVALIYKKNNRDLNFFVGTVPDDWMDGDEEKAQRKVRRFREMHIQPQIPAIRQHYKEGQSHQLVLKDQTHLQYGKKQAEKADKELNFEVKYWSQEGKGGQVKLVFDPHHSQIHIFILQKTPLRAVQAVITPESLPSENQSLQTLFNALQKPQLKCSQTHIILEHQLFNSVLIQNSAAVAKINQQNGEDQEEELLEKLNLFKHIFLTEVITHMILNRFGRIKKKHIKQREGYDRIEYEDEELEVLTMWGYRMYEFRDHPIKWAKKKKKGKQNMELDSLDEEQKGAEEEKEKESEKEGDEKQQENMKEESKGKKGKKAKIVVEKIGVKVKKVRNGKKKEKDICNFTFMSGYQKSSVNNIRYCLHQMTRETDHTQALMDFICLVFEAIPRKQLLGILRKAIYHLDGKKQVKYEYEKGEMSRFLTSFKVKRNVLSCLAEYTKNSFFHEILNISLRLFHTPYQLVYLRLGFSHIFYSIKLLYHRNKRAIFQDEKKNDKSKITLYRGCSITEEEEKELKMNVGCYVEAEGFLSTSLLESVTEKFKKNLLMIIEVPASNLKGLYDNGLADISLTSYFSTEKEVLINAFNLFKILSFRKANKDEQAHVLRLEYGSIRGVEEKVKKSEDLLDKEYLWKVDKEQILLIKKKLEVNEERMTEHWHTKLTNLLIPEEQRLWKRKQKLKQEAKDEYQKALSKLTSWDKELLLNTKHQEYRLAKIQHYGELLFESDEHRKGCSYFRRRIKQMELHLAVEGPHWRNSQCLVEKQKVDRYLLSLCYNNLGRVENTFVEMKKLLNIYISINIPKKDECYWTLLLELCDACGKLGGKEEEREKYKKQAMEIINKYSLQNKQVYKRLMQREKWDKQREKVTKEKEKKKENMTRAEKKKAKEQQKRIKTERKQVIKEKKKELYSIRIHSHGLTQHYLFKLWQLINILHAWQRWKSVLIQGNRYLQIRSNALHGQNRYGTCLVFSSMLDACQARKSTQQLRTVCGHLTCFTHSSIHQACEYQMVLKCIQTCLNLNCWGSGRIVVMKLIEAKIKFQLTQRQISEMMIFGYVLLLLSVSIQDIVDNFLEWIQNLYLEHQHRDSWDYSIVLKQVIRENEKYNNSEKDVLDERRKEYIDETMIEYAGELLKDGKGRWKRYTWKKNRFQLIPWQHPFYLLFHNVTHSGVGVFQYLEGGSQLNMVIELCLQYKNSQYNMVSNCKSFLQHVCSISKLHLNEDNFQSIPQLLSFFCNMRQLRIVQMGEMQIDVEKSIQMTEHLQEEKKSKLMKIIKKQKEHILKNREMTGKSLHIAEIGWMRQVYRKYNRYKVIYAAKSPFRREKKLIK